MRLVKLRRTLTALGISIAMMICGVLGVNAQAGYSYAFGGTFYLPKHGYNYEDIKQAAYYATVMGYHSYYSGELTYSYLNSQRINSDLTYFSCHGGPDILSFSEAGLDVTRGYSNGKNQIGLLSWNLTNNKLMVFDACSTAVGSSNICTTAVQQGADAVLGWYDIISTESFDWLQRFYYRLGTGTSIQTAINYADSFNDYSSDSNLKKHTLFGNANQVLKKTRSGGILEDPREHPVEEFYIDFDNIDYTVIEKALRAEFPNFNIDDYKIRVSSTNPENTNFVIDFNEVVNGCWTSSGYTLIFIDNKTSIVYDNTIKSPSSTKQSIITHNATESEIINYKTEAAQKIPNGESVIRQYGENCLDISTGKTYYRVYTIFGPAGTKFKRIMTEDFYQ